MNSESRLDERVPTEVSPKSMVGSYLMGQNAPWAPKKWRNFPLGAVEPCVVPALAGADGAPQCAAGQPGPRLLGCCKLDSRAEGNITETGNSANPKTPCTKK